MIRSASLTHIAAAYVVALAVALAWVTAGPGTGRHWLDALIADLLATLVIFVFSRAHKNSTFYDAHWSVAPPLLLAFWWVSADPVGETARAVLVATVVVVWSVRLTANRAVGFPGFHHEDWRYPLLRERVSGDVMERGLWGWSRHPNYLGELGFWVSLARFGVAASPGDAWWLVVGALARLAMFLGASIPMMEQRSLDRRPGYQDVVDRVPRFLPRPVEWQRDDRIGFDRFRGLRRARTVHGTLTGLDLAGRWPGTAVHLHFPGERALPQHHGRSGGRSADGSSGSGSPSILLGAQPGRPAARTQRARPPRGAVPAWLPAARSPVGLGAGRAARRVAGLRPERSRLPLPPVVGGHRSPAVDRRVGDLPRGPARRASYGPGRAVSAG